MRHFRHQPKKGKDEGAKPLQNLSSPSCKEDVPIMERGIKGVRLMNNLREGKGYG